jgi:hypothetical protein
MEGRRGAGIVAVRRANAKSAQQARDHSGPRHVFVASPPRRSRAKCRQGVGARRKH